MKPSACRPAAPVASSMFSCPKSFRTFSLRVGNFAFRLMVAFLFLGLVPAPVPSQTPARNDSERQLFDAANRERVALKLQPLRWDDALAAAARKHAAVMVEHTELSHQLPGEPALDQRAGQAGARFTEVGENIAIGWDAQVIHTGWMHSPGHRANILDGRFTALGVGVVEEEEGELYAVEDFSAAVANLILEEQEEKVAMLISAMGLRVTSERAEARNECTGEGNPLRRRSMYIARYGAPDISKLPENLEKMIRVGEYRQAAVGACVPKDSGAAIRRFRIAVLLFAVEDLTLSLEQQEKQVTALLTAKGWSVSRTTEDARIACKSNMGVPGRSWSVVRFDTTDLSQLPPDVEGKIRKVPYRNVAVGACRAGEAVSFAYYRIALLFF